MISIHTNLSSIIAQESLKGSTNKLNLAVERMSSGYKINHAKDNAANYSIATNMTTKLNAYQVAEDNVAMGLDMLTTASESLSLIEDKLMRLRALAVQSVNDTYGTQSKKTINSEVKSIVKEIKKQYSTASYNGINLFDAVPKKTIVLEPPTLNEEGFIVDVERTDTTGMTRVSEIANKNASLTDGTYAICDLEDLLTLAEMLQNSYISGGDTFVMGADIDLKEHCEANVATGGWEPIKNFKGTFDGNGHTISNLKINRPTSDYQGLFSSFSNAIVKNLKLENVDIVGQKRVAGLSGEVSGNNSIVENISVSGNIQAIEDVGGVIGYTLNKTNISNIYSSSTVKGETKVGGIIGWTYVGPNVKNLLATGDVYGIGSSSGIGGVIGKFQTSSAEDIYVTANVYAPNSQDVGGLVGNSTYSTIKNVYSTGDVEGARYVGGIFGNTYSSTANPNILTNAYVTGDIKGSLWTGGIGGQLYGTIENCTFKGEINGAATGKGGLVGSISQNATINNCSFEGNGNFNGTYEGILAGWVNPSTAVEINILNCQVLNVVETRASLVGNISSSASSTVATVNIFNCVYNKEYDTKVLPLVRNVSNVTLNMENNKASDFEKTIDLQVGINGDSSSKIGVTTSFELNNINSLSNIGLDLDTDYVSLLDSYLNLASGKQTQLGAAQNRLMSAFDSITVNIQNLASSRSTIRDADMAKLSSTYIQQQILQEASATLLATANQSPAIALQLI